MYRHLVQPGAQAGGIRRYHQECVTGFAELGVSGLRHRSLVRPPIGGRGLATLGEATFSGTRVLTERPEFGGEGAS